MSFYTKIIDVHDTKLSKVYQKLINAFGEAVPVDFYSTETDTPTVVVDAAIPMWRKYNWMEFCLHTVDEDVLQIANKTYFVFCYDKMAYMVVYGSIEHGDLETLQNQVRKVAKQCHEKYYKPHMGEL